MRGEGFARVGGNKPTQNSDKVLEHGMRASKALRRSARRSIEAPSEVWKGIQADAISGFASLYSSMPQNQSIGNLVGQLNTLLSGEFGKTISLTSPLSTGLVPFDLVAPSRLIYPVYSPLRNKLPRTQGQGTSRRTKVFTGISGSHTGGSSVLDWSISELPGGGNLTTTWPNQLPSSGSQTAVDVNIPYKFFGITEALSWLAQFSGQGFEDISALANLILLQEAMLAEEHMLLEGSGGHSVTPGTPTVAARTAATGETALTGVTTNVSVKVAGTNFFGETVASAAGSTAWSSGQVVDVTIAAGAGDVAYNIYVGTGASPSAWYLMASDVGGHKYTLQGALPTGGTAAPTADSGTGATTRYDGLIAILTGNTVASTYPATGYTAGYINQSVGSTLTNAVLFDLFAGLWDDTSSLNTSTSGGFRADPQELIGEGLDFSNFSANILAQASGGQQGYTLYITQDELANIRAGAAVGQIQNPITRSLVRLVTHPYLQQGTVLAMTYTLPMSFANVSNAWEVTNVQDYISISWPVIDVTFRYSLFLYGTLIGYAPQWSGILQGIQRSGSSSGGNWT